MNINELKFKKEPIDATNNRIDCLNLSSIFSALIKESAKCDCYSSDIVYDIYAIMKEVENKTLKSEVKYFGFRDCGVDFETFLSLRLESGLGAYRDIWKMVIVRDKDDYVDIALYGMEV